MPAVRRHDGVVLFADLAGRLLDTARAHDSQRAAETINSGPPCAPPSSPSPPAPSSQSTSRLPPRRCR